MRKIVIIYILFLFGTALAAEPAWENMIEACMLEAQKRGHDITNDKLVNHISDAVLNENKKVIKKYCPQTFQNFSK